MEKINNGGPAFPQTIDDMGTMRSLTQGMSLRDYFAGQALAGWLASYGENCRHPSETNYDEAVAEYSYKLADAMLRERSKNEKV